MDSTFTNFSANADANVGGGVINIDGTAGSGITIMNSTIEACEGENNRALQMGSDDTFDYITYDINNTSEGLAYQITSITPNSIN